MAGITVSQLSDYMGHGMNVLISGWHGTAKSHMAMQAAAKLGWKMKYYSTSTLDPFTDLVGVPFPENINGKKTLEMVRPHEIDQADVIFFDELNRGDSKTLNAVFEIVQFHSINGEPLPNLKAVIAAVNPNNGEYAVSDLDPALLDRWDIYLESSKDPSLSYLKTVFPTPLATALVTWHKEYTNGSAKNKVYVSPRRLEMIGRAFTKIPNLSTVQNALPPGGAFDSTKLFQMLAAANGTPVVTPSPKARTPKVKAITYDEVMKISDGREIRNKWAASIQQLLDEGTLTKAQKSKVHERLAYAYRDGVGASRLLRSPVARALYDISKNDPNNWKLLSKNWAYQKNKDWNQEAAKFARTLP